MPSAFIWLLALVIAAFWWTLDWMLLRWSEPDSYYSHGWLVPLIAAYLLLRRRRDLATCSPQSYAPGLLLLVPSLLLHLLATAWRVGFLSGFAFLGALGGLVLTFFGKRFLRLAIFPLAFLVFMLPLPEVLVDSISFPMKVLSAVIARSVVSVMDVPAVAGQHSNEILIGTGKLVVDDVCSGLKYLISLMAFAALYAHLSSVKLWQKWAIFLCSVPISFAANVARVVLMVIVGHVWGIGAVDKWYFHDLFGFVLFAVAFVLLFILESLMLKTLCRPGRRRADEECRTSAGAGALGATVAYESSGSRREIPDVLFMAIVGVLAVYLLHTQLTGLVADALSRIGLVETPFDVQQSGTAGKSLRESYKRVRLPDTANGLKCPILLMAFGMVFAHLPSKRPEGDPSAAPRRWPSFIRSLIAALLAHIARVSVMLVLAGQSGAGGLSSLHAHDLIGLLVFIIALACLFGAERIQWWKQGTFGSGAISPSAARPAHALHSIVLSCAALAAAVSTYFVWPRAVERPGDVFAAIPTVLGDWRGRDASPEGLFHNMTGRGDVLFRIYTKESSGAIVQFLAVVAQETRRRTHPPEQSMIGGEYRKTDSRDLTFKAVIEGRPRLFPVRELVAASPRGYVVAWYFYKSDDSISTSYWKHQATVAFKKLANPRAADVLIRLEAEFAAGELQSVRRAFEDFLFHAMPHVVGKLPR